MRRTIATTVTASAALLVLAACSSTAGIATPAPADAYTRYSAALDAAAVERNQANGREAFGFARDRLCPQGRPAIDALKAASRGDPAKAAAEAGAMWEFGCDQGHDAELYAVATPTPMPTADVPSMAPAPHPYPTQVAPTTRETFYPGDCDLAIRTFQLAANTLNSHFDFEGTGCYADETRVAVRAIQLQNDLPVNDVLDPVTYDHVFSGDPVTDSTWRAAQ